MRPDGSSDLFLSEAQLRRRLDIYKTRFELHMSAALILTEGNRDRLEDRAARLITQYRRDYPDTVNSFHRWFDEYLRSTPAPRPAHDYTTEPKAEPVLPETLSLSERAAEQKGEPIPLP